MRVRDVRQQRISAQKHRGAFFTPLAVSRFLARWALRSATDRVLEPSVGEASFLFAAAEYLNQLGAHELFGKGHLEGVEIHAPSIESAVERIAETGHHADIRHADFFDVPASHNFDAVLGNPPFVRFQTFSGDGREKALRAALAAGVNLSGLASSWAPFVVHASEFLRPDGRLGFVLPAEVLTVKYAAPIREFLLRRFKSVRLVVFSELIFPNALEDVILLLAEGSGGCSYFEVHQVKNAEALNDSPLRNWRIRPGDATKWAHALVEPDIWKLYKGVLASKAVERLGEWGHPYLGAVTGDNRYFALTNAEVQRWKLGLDDVVPISPPGSRHLRGLEFGRGAWEESRAEGKRCWLFCPPDDELSPGAERYIEAGEELGVDRAYKCRVRDPWYVTPKVAIPDLFLTYMDHERPRLTTNAANVYHLNSLYGITLRTNRRAIGRDLLPLASLNTVSLLSAEVVGRSYGGGLLKLEPTEAEQLAIPSLVTTRRAQDALLAIKPQVAVSLRNGRLSEAASIVDQVLFVQTGTIDHTMIQLLRGAREFLFQRRLARGRTCAEDHKED